jgi:hypothetical protein
LKDMMAGLGWYKPEGLWNISRILVHVEYWPLLINFDHANHQQLMLTLMATNVTWKRSWAQVPKNASTNLNDAHCAQQTRWTMVDITSQTPAPNSEPRNAAQRCHLTPALLLRGSLFCFGDLPMYGLEYPGLCTPTRRNPRDIVDEEPIHNVPMIMDWKRRDEHHS